MSETTDRDGAATERVERTDRGISVSVKLKRGTGTRDQDTVTGKFKGESLSEYVDRREEFLDELEKTATQAREMAHPEEDDG